MRDHIIGLLVEVLAKDMFFLRFSFRASLSLYIYLALIAFLSRSSSTDHFVLPFTKGPTVYCFLFIFSSSVSTSLTSGSIGSTFSFFLPSSMFLDSLNLLLRALTISSISLPAFSSFSFACSEFSYGSSRLKEKNLRLLWFVFSLM